MEQFSLEKYLENPSRKIVTRRGNPVRIICTDRKHGEDELPVVFLEQCHNGEFLLACRKDGRSDTYDTPYDLFFADEEEEPANEDLKEAAKQHSKQTFNGLLIEDNIDAFIAGAEWQKQKDLEDSLKSDMTMPNKFYEKGRFDMREEMMKNTVLETEVLMDCDGDGIETPYEEWLTLENTEIPYIPNNLGLKEGDKVKIIICKTEQQ